MDLKKQLLMPLYGLLAVIVIGTIGYRIISYGDPNHGIIDCLYMTMITLTTVGFGEIIDLTGKPEARLFTIGLLLVGMGVLMYFVTNLTALMVEGHFNRWVWSRKMTKDIGRLVDHFIVCGAGNTGIHVINELIQTRRPLVVVDRSEQTVALLRERYGEQAPPVVIGDATDDETLRQANIASAHGVIACLSADKDNILLTMTARDLEKTMVAEGRQKNKLRIIARAVELKTMDKLRRVGADSVVSPNFIGGMRMVSEMIRPTVVTFLDKMLRDKEKNLRVENVAVPPGSPFIGKSLRDLKLREVANVLLLAVEMPDGESWIYNPTADFAVAQDMKLVFLCSPECRLKVEEAAQPHR